MLINKWIEIGDRLKNEGNLKVSDWQFICNQINPFNCLKVKYYIRIYARTTL